MSTSDSLAGLGADLLGGRDLFEVWRFLLGTLCTIYAIVMTARSLWGWIAYLSAPGRTMTLMRNYVVVSLLRLRVRRHAWELTQTAFWLAVLAVLLDLHRNWLG